MTQALVIVNPAAHHFNTPDLVALPGITHPCKHIQLIYPKSRNDLIAVGTRCWFRVPKGSRAAVDPKWVWMDLVSVDDDIDLTTRMTGERVWPFQL